jgi:hypothetical protein
MPISASPRFLRNLLFADAASCLATGGLQVMFTSPLAQILNLPAALLAATGWFLLAYGAIVGFVATREPLPRAPIWLFMAGNMAWALACAVLLAGRWLAPTTLGAAWILAQAGAVAVLALLQWTGLRRSGRVSGWA